MSHNRYARRADATTQQIVNELRSFGFEVAHISRPVDIAIRWPAWPPAQYVLMECKTPKGKQGAVKLRNDQLRQQIYCRRNLIPYVTSGRQAMEWLTYNGYVLGRRELPRDFEVRGI